MAYNKQYKDFLEISPNFESVVDIDADKRNQNLWREYIVGDDMENLVDVLCQSLGNEAPDARRSFWVHGSYGTGKSYAAIFVKHLLEEKPEVIDEFLSKSSRLSKYRNRFMKCRNKGDYLVIWKTGCTGIRTGDMMLVEAEQAVREALVAKFGDKADLGGASLISAVTDRLDDASINWDHVIENTILSDDYSSVEELRAAVSSGKLSAIQTTAMVLRDMKFGLISNLDTFENWLTEVIDANGLAKSGIFFIWDEFTEYVAHKAVMSTAFRNFLYSSSPALADVATTLSIQPVDLSDRLHLSMQGEIYTWTEQQVADKLADIVNEYQYLVEVDHALGQNYRNLEDARKDLANRFKYQRIPFTAVEDIQKPWYPALKALRTLSLGKVAHLTADERNADAAALRSYGKSANDFLTDSKPTLADILDDRDVNCTAEELDAIYSGLKSTPFDATLTQFNHLLDQQVARIGQARNRSKLKALWESVTGKESVKAWCDSFSTPIFWVIPKELRKPIHTVIDLQSGITTPRDTEVIAAIDALQNEKARVLTDAQKVYAALYETVGSEYVTYFKVHRPELLAKLKLSHGNDMSTWEAPELSRLQSMMKSAIQQQARQEKLQNTKNEIAEMPVSRLRENIASFLDSHPEYCDEFLK